MLRKLSKDISVYGLGNLLVKLLAFAIFPIYTHVFTVEEYGIMALVITIAALTSVILEAGLINSLPRFYYEASDDKKKLLFSSGLWIIIIWPIFITGILLGLIYPFHDLIEDKYHIVWIFLLLALLGNIPKQVLLYAINILRLNLEPWKYSFMVVLEGLLGIILGLIFILVYDMGLTGFFLGTLVGLIIALVPTYFLIRKHLFFRFDKALAKELLAYGYPFIFMNIAYWVFGSMDRWLLTELSDNTQVGLYSIAFKIGSVVMFISMAFGQAWSPLAMKLHSDNPDYKTIYSKVFSYWFFIIVVIGMILSLFGYEILTLTTPQPYWLAVSALPFILMGCSIGGMQSVAVLGIYVQKRTKFVAYAAWISAIVNLALNLLFIPRFGAAGAAFATLVSNIVLVGAYLFWSQRLHPIPLENGKLLFCIVVVLLTLGCTIYLNGLVWDWWLFFLKIFLCIAVIISGFLFKIIDFSSIKKIIPKR